MRVEGISLKDSKRRGMEGLGIANDFVLFKGWRRGWQGIFEIFGGLSGLEICNSVLVLLSKCQEGPT